MSVHGLLSVADTERAKLAKQLKVRLVLLACVVAPFGFAAAMRVQDSLPEDTLFGRAVKDSGFALPLVILGFAAFWAFPAMTSVVGGDMFSAEDRYGTWSTLLTRSRSRREVFAGKVLVASSFSVIAVMVLAAASMAAGVLVLGVQPLVDLSGVERRPVEAALRVVVAWGSVLPPAMAFTAVAALVSVATRSSAAGIGLPVLAGLALQLGAMLDGPELPRRLLITSAFGAWHGLFVDPPYYMPLVHGLLVSSGYVVACLMVAYRLLERRDVGR